MPASMVLGVSSLDFWALLFLFTLTLKPELNPQANITKRKLRNALNLDMKDNVKRLHRSWCFCVKNPTFYSKRKTKISVLIPFPANWCSESHQRYKKTITKGKFGRKNHFPYFKKISHSSQKITREIMRNFQRAKSQQASLLLLLFPDSEQL